MSEAIQQLLAEGVSAHPLGDDQVIVVVDRRGVVFDRADLEFLLAALRKCPEEKVPGPVLMPSPLATTGMTTRSADAPPARAPRGALQKARVVSAARRERAKAEATEGSAEKPTAGDRDWVAIEQVVRSLGVTAASNRFGVPYHTINTRATKEGWITPKTGTGRLTAREGVSVEPGMKRRCPSCQQITTANPCAHCQAAA